VEKVFGPNLGGWLDRMGEWIMALPSPLDVILAFAFTGALIVSILVVVGFIWLVTSCRGGWGSSGYQVICGVTGMPNRRPKKP
jgi:hypothetical protein